MGAGRACVVADTVKCNSQGRQAPTIPPSLKPTMNTQDAIRKTLKTSSIVLSRYVDDLSDVELMQRPGPGCNHIAWQLGHLIASENQLLESVAPGAGIELPAGFVEQHSKDTTGDDNPQHFS